MATFDLEARSFSSKNRSHSSLSSDPSHLSLHPPAIQQAQRYAPRLRSQFPANSIENHVEYILVASFDIDRGSIMEHQYPGPISGDENMLAELMLPDQAHVRSQDWTIFFLHKDTTAEEEAREERRERRRRRKRRKEAIASGQEIDEEEEPWMEGDDIDTDDDSQDDDEVEGAPLIYVLNLVNTKQDQTVKRGAIVKAMAICTRHSFLHIYKPLLLLALEEYFRAPQIQTLESLYNAVNSMDLSLMPRMTPLERNILQASDVRDMFVEKFATMIQQRIEEDAHRLSRGSQRSSGSSPIPSKVKYQLPRDTHEFESKVFYNNVPVPIKVPVSIAHEQVGDFSLVKLFTTFSAPHREAPQSFPLHSHLTTSGPNTHPIIVLINALLTQKRIIFLGHNMPSGSVAEAVLAACALASGGILKGFTRYAFPYTDLTKIDDLLKVPGFIAGVTNPAFAHKHEWWDLLCDLPTGRMKISPKIHPAPMSEGYIYFQQNGIGSSKAVNSYVNGGNHDSDPTGDTHFMESIQSAINNRQGEIAVRARLRSWVSRFTLISATFEEIVYGASALHIGASETDADAYGYGVSGHGLVWPDEGSRLREIQANVGRVEGWRQSRSYFSLIRDLARQWERGDCVRGIDLGYQIDRLRHQKIGESAAAEIYTAIAVAMERAGAEADDDPGLDEEDEVSEQSDPTGERAKRLRRLRRARYVVINQLLSVMPESSGGLFHLSLGFFHRDAAVRTSVVRILEMVMNHEAGRHFWAALGRYAKLAFFRVKREAEGKGL